MNIQEVIEQAEPGRTAITGDTITISHYPDPPEIFRINGEIETDEQGLERQAVEVVEEADEINKE